MKQVNPKSNYKNNNFILKLTPIEANVIQIDTYRHKMVKRRP